MNSLPRVKRMVLRALIAETDINAPPTPKGLQARIEAMYGESMEVSSHLQWLIANDYVVQPYSYGPYIPVRDEDGTRLELTLIRVLKEEEVQEEPPPVPLDALDEGWDAVDVETFNEWYLSIPLE